MFPTCQASLFGYSSVRMAATTAYVIRALPGLPQLGGDGMLIASPRARMLDAMTAAVAEQGYAATSIAEVINQAHASRRTFYEQFADKEGCFLAAYQLATDYVTERLAEAVEGSPAELSERLTRIYETYLRELSAYPLAARAFINRDPRRRRTQPTTPPHRLRPVRRTNAHPRQRRQPTDPHRRRRRQRRAHRPRNHRPRNRAATEPLPDAGRARNPTAHPDLGYPISPIVLGE